MKFPSAEVRRKFVQFSNTKLAIDEAITWKISLIYDFSETRCGCSPINSMLSFLTFVSTHSLWAGH